MLIVQMLAVDKNSSKALTSERTHELRRVGKKSRISEGKISRISCKRGRDGGGKGRDGGGEGHSVLRCRVVQGMVGDRGRPRYGSFEGKIAKAI